MSETYQIVPTAPFRRAPRTGAGRPKSPNPFLDSVAQIVGTTEARSAVFDLDAANGETLKQRHGRIRRFLTAAGKVHEASIAMTIRPGQLDESGALVDGPEGRYVVTFQDRRGASA